MKRFLRAWIVLLWAASAQAQVPQLIHYQGRLLDGTNLVNGTVGLSLRLLHAPGGGSPQYEDSNSVTVADGLYATFLGDQTNAGSFAGALTNAMARENAESRTRQVDLQRCIDALEARLRALEVR